MKPKIYINAGHSNDDPGAVGYEVERELNVIVSKHQNDYLLANYECETRMSTGDMGISAVCRDANAWGAHLITSNHMNSGKGDGYEALVYNQKRVELGKIFAKHVLAAGQNLRSSSVAPGVKIRTDLGILKYTNMPAIINEGAFVDNLKDIADWNDDEELKKLGIAYAKAAAEFLKLEEKPKEEPTPIYTLEQFVRDVQSVTGSSVDGKAGPETISNTVTISRHKNSSHKLVKFVQKRLYALGYTQVGTDDGIAGAKFEEAMKAFQRANGCYEDGEAAEWSKTWHGLLGMI